MLQDFVYLYQFQKNTWKSRSELEDIQSKKLRALIKHAYQNVRFYREAFIERNLQTIDFAVIEIIKDNFLEGGDGSMLVTGLHNYAMPLIRYQNGDAAQVSQQERCSCGRGLPLIGKIKGRMDDMIMCSTLPNFSQGIDKKWQDHPYVL